MRHFKTAEARLLLVVFTVAMVLRGVPVLLHRLEADRVATVDSERYLDLADRLVAGDGFGLIDPASGEVEPELLRTPGYPVLLALADGLSGFGPGWILGLQIFAGAITAVLCGMLISVWTSPCAGLVAGTLLAVDPAHIIYSNLLMADILCGASIAAGLVLLEQSRHRPPSPGGRSASWPEGSWRLVAAGCLLGMATALRPVAVLLAAPAALYLLRRGCARKRVAAFLVAALLFPVGWTLRNGLTTGSWTISNAFDVNLALVVAAKIEARTGDVPRSLGEARVMARVAAKEISTGLAFHRACRAVAFDTLREAPWAALIEVPVSVGEMLLMGERRYLFQVLGLGAGDGRERWRSGLLGPGFESYSHLERMAVIGQAAFMAVIWILAAVGVVTLWRRGQADVALFALAALTVVLAPSLVVGTGRMRLPVTILIHGLAGIGGAAAVRTMLTKGRTARSA